MQPNYYYPTAANTTTQPQYAAAAPVAGMVPMFVPNPQHQPSYVMPMAAAAAPVQQAAGPTSAPGQHQQPTAMVAYEQNGMTYYVDSSQMPMYAAAPTQGMEGYAQASYAVPGMGGMMTPSPEGYYYQPVTAGAGVYYQPQ